MYFGAYVHPDFQRDDPTRACTIQRRTGSTLGSDRRFKTTTQPAANDDQIRNSGNNVISDLHESFCSLGTWQSSCDKKPEVMLDSDWNTVSPTIVSVKGSDSVLPRHVSPQDDWLAELQLVFASSPAMQDAASPSKGMLSFVEFKSLFEPRPIEFMIHR